MGSPSFADIDTAHERPVKPQSLGGLSMYLCANCFVHGFCKKETTKVVSDRRIVSPDFLRDLRAFTSQLKISSDHWVDFLIDTYRDYPGRIFQDGNEVYLDTEALETPSMREWARDFLCQPVRNGAQPRPRKETRERIRVVATILATRYPFEVSMFGVRAANDNHAPSQSEKT